MRYDQTHRENLRKSLTGRKLSDQHKLHISLSKKNKSNKKISETQKNTVACKDMYGKFKRVSKNLFARRYDLVGIAKKVDKQFLDDYLS